MAKTESPATAPFLLGAALADSARAWAEYKSAKFLADDACFYEHAGHEGEDCPGCHETIDASGKTFNDK